MSRLSQSHQPPPHGQRSSRRFPLCVVQDLRRPDIQAAVIEWSQSLAPSTVRVNYGYFASMMKAAVSGEHCPMCSAAHAWVGLGRIVYAVSSATLSGWLAEWGVAPGAVLPLPINAVAPAVQVDGPAPELEDGMKALHRQRFD